MPTPKTYTTARAFRTALEERLKRAALTDRIDLIRLRRLVSFDRLLARLFREDLAPWVLKGGYALELRFKAARSTVDIDLTVQRVETTEEGGDTNQAIRAMLQSAADISLGDWFEFTVGPASLDLTAAPCGMDATDAKFFICNLGSLFQVVGRGFDPRLPLHDFLAPRFR